MPGILGLLGLGNVDKELYCCEAVAGQLHAHLGLFSAACNRKHPEPGHALLGARGMLKTDASGEPVRVNGRVQPLVPYPYADDGLDVWYALSSYFEEYLSIYYSDAPGRQARSPPGHRCRAWCKTLAGLATSGGLP